MNTGSVPRAIRSGAVALAAAVLVACGGSAATPEQALADWLARAEAAAERRDRSALVALVSDAYADARGNDRDAVNDRIRLYFLRQGSVGLLTHIDDIQVLGGSAATMTVTVGMAGRPDGTFGLNADAYRFELELESDGDDWLLIGARWGEIGQVLR